MDMLIDRIPWLKCLVGRIRSLEERRCRQGWCWSSGLGSHCYVRCGHKGAFLNVFVRDGQIVDVLLVLG